ncbi:urease accessory protein UreE [Natronomonas sp.]|jgi:urease accessory protein|uniref:urease accessory protein UreE n=1 Tax=Natronomonas sp. TaxID=2184060 RepID=UPI00398A14B6
MRRIDGVVGNRHDDPDLDERIAAHDDAGTLERVRIDSGERKKSRLRVETDAGTDLGIVVGNVDLRSGDVLFIDDNGAAVVTFETREAFVVELPAPTEPALAAVAEFGHRVGNQHWDIAVESGTVYVPVDVEKRVLEDVLKPYIPDGAKTGYESVEAELFVGDENASAGEGHEHAHTLDDGHGHEHGDGEHPHSHEHESDGTTSHSHE